MDEKVKQSKDCHTCSSLTCSLSFSLIPQNTPASHRARFGFTLCATLEQGAWPCKECGAHLPSLQEASGPLTPQVGRQSPHRLRTG